MTLTTTERKPPTIIEKLFAVEDLREAAARWDTRAELLADLRRGIDTTPTEGELLSGMRAQMLRRVADALEAESYGTAARIAEDVS